MFLAALMLLAMIIVILFFRDAPSVQIARQLRDISAEESEILSGSFGQQLFPDASLNILQAFTSGSLSLVVMAGSTLAFFLALSVFVPTYFTERFLISAKSASWIVTGAGMGAAGAPLLVGPLMDRFPSLCWFVFPVSISSVAACCVGLYFCTNPWPAAVLVVVMLILTASANLSCFRLIDKVSPSSASATIGLMETAGNLLGFALPLSFSLFNSNLRLVAFLLAGINLLALAANLILIAFQRKRIASV